MPAIRNRLCVVLFLLFSAANLTAADSGASSKTSSSTNAKPARIHSVVQKLGNLPLRFEPNRGQTDARVKYLAHGPGYTLFLTSDEAVLTVAKPAEPRGHERDKRDVGARQAVSGLETAVIRMRLIGVDSNAAITAEALQSGVTNYFIGNDRTKWRTGIPGYGRVSYKSVYPGIDLAFYGNPQRLEYDFTAGPGADPARIQLAFEGADKIENASNGDLLLRTRGETVVVHKPLVYQQDKSKPVDAQFVVNAGNHVSFALGAYDHSQPLTIDPVLTYSSYLGGSYQDRVISVALDSQRNIVLAGTTASTDFPITVDSGSHGNTDVFLTILGPTGAHLLYSDYIGGSGNDTTYSGVTGSMLQLDSHDNIYLAGATGSPDFPQLHPLQAAYGGGTSDAFAMILNANGLVFSSFIGGAGYDGASGIALDAAGDIILGGQTNSVNFPTTNPLVGYSPNAGVYGWSGANPWQQFTSGLLDRAINSVTINPANHSILYAATNGGGIYTSTNGGAQWAASGLNNLTIHQVAIDPVNPANMYAATSSGLYKSTNGGTSWVFTGPSTANTLSIAVDPQSPNIVIAGTSGNIFRSTASGTAGSWLLTTSPGGAATNKLTFDPGISTRVYAARDTGVWVSNDTGASWTQMTTPLPNSVAVAVDPFNSNVLYAGSHDITGVNQQGLYKSTDAGATWTRIAGNFVRDVVMSPSIQNTLYVSVNAGLRRSADGGSTFAPLELTNLAPSQLAVVSGDGDSIYVGTLTAGAPIGFVTKLAPNGASYAYSTFLGGTQYSTDVAGVATDLAGNAAVTGDVSSGDFPLVNAFQTQNLNGQSCFVTRINSGGTAFIYSTFLGGSTWYSSCRAAAEDSSGNVFVTGSVGDTDFPLVNPRQEVYGGGAGDAIITKFGPTGGTPLYSTYWGGAGDEDGQALFLDGSGNLYVSGDTASVNFPLVGPTQETPGFSANDSGYENAFVMKLAPSGSVLFSTYLGGSSTYGYDSAGGLYANSNGDIFAVGYTGSTDFPVTGSAFQVNNNTVDAGTGTTGFLSRFSFFPPAVQLSTNLVQFGSVTQNLTSPPQTVTLTNVGTGPLDLGHIIQTTEPINPGSPFSVSTDCTDIVPAGNSCHGYFTFTPPSVGEFADQFVINDNAPDSPQIIQFTGTGVPTYAAASVTPSALHFGNVGQNFTSPGQTVTITSTGTTPLLFNSITTSDPQFAVLNNTCPASLDPGNSCTVTVDVTPAGTGFISANLVISDDAADSPQQVSLDATGIETVTVTQPISPTEPNTFNFPGQTYNYTVTFPPGTDFSGVTAAVTVGPTSTTDFQARVGTSFPGASCIQYNGAGGTCTVFQIKCTPSPCPTTPQPNIVVKTAFDSSQPVINPGFLQAESGTNHWHNIFTEFLLPKIDGTIKGGTNGFSDFVAVNLPPPAGVPLSTFVGFLSPLGPTNSRSFSAGSTIPVKFRVRAANGSQAPVTNLTARLTLTTGQMEVPVKLGAGNGTAPNVFKYVPGSTDYEFYLDTTGLPAGTYQLTVFSNSFAAVQVTFTLF